MALQAMRYAMDPKTAAGGEHLVNISNASEAAFTLVVMVGIKIS